MFTTMNIFFNILGFDNSGLELDHADVEDKKLYNGNSSKKYCITESNTNGVPAKSSCGKTM